MVPLGSLISLDVKSSVSPSMDAANPITGMKGQSVL